MKSSTILSTLALPFLYVTSVTAHGWVQTLTVDGKEYKGNEPSENAQPTKDSVIQRIQNNAPIKLNEAKNIVCGRGASTAALVADAKPGSEITFDWVAGGGQTWPHDTGPVLTYLASCGSKACNQFDASKAKWFKIAQQGKKSNGDWAQKDIQAGKPSKATLPKNLAAGNYLIRHEIVALHLATTEGGVEFYPSCSQLRVTGSQTGKPKESDLVTFPAAYSARDPGLLVTDLYNPNLKYDFPGPSLATFVSGQPSQDESNDEDDDSEDKPTTSTKASSKTTSSPPASTPTPGGIRGGITDDSDNTDNGGCRKRTRRVKKRASLHNKRSFPHPHRISRIMRAIDASELL